MKKNILSHPIPISRLLEKLAPPFLLKTFTYVKLLIMNTLLNCSLWGDEAFSAIAAQKPFLSMMNVVIKDTSPPLFYIISFIWFKIFGSSEIAIRSLSFLFYLGTALVVYLIAKELFRSIFGAVLAAILTFFNPFLFPYAFEGRMYFCLLFFVVLSFYFLVKKNEKAYIFSAAAALYSHHFAVFAIAAQFVWRLTAIKKINKKYIWKIIKPYFWLALLYLPWIYPLYLQTSLVSSGFWLGKPKLKHLLGTFSNFAKIPLLAGVILLIRKWQQKNRAKDWLLVLWLILPPLITFFISQSKLSIFYERYLLYCVPALMLLFTSQVRKLSYLLISIILTTYILTSWHTFAHPFKKPFRQFAGWVKSNVSENTFIVNYNGKAHHLWETKYYGIKAPIYSPGGPLPFYVGTAQMTASDVVFKLPANKPIGLVSSDDPQSIKIEGYQIKKFHQLNSLYFIWLEKQ